jgi:hypothetical protein
MGGPGMWFEYGQHGRAGDVMKGTGGCEYEGRKAGVAAQKYWKAKSADSSLHHPKLRDIWVLHSGLICFNLISRI